MISSISSWLLLILSFFFRLEKISSSFDGRRVLLATGNFTIDGVQSNIAQYDFRTGVWSPKYISQLFLYGEDNGIIWDVAVNTSETYGKMYTVGLFDAASKTSQIQLCSVARCDGINFEKVGEGLCSRGGDIGSITIKTVVIGNGGNLFVGGNFATRVWDGHHFVYVYHVAQYEATLSAWLPLTGGGELRCANESIDSRVNALAWDAESSILYIGGKFHFVDDRRISSGLAAWSPQHGLESFPGSGVSQTPDDPFDAEVHALAFESTTKSLFIAGTFIYMNGSFCPSVMVWNRMAQSWRCLLNDQNYRFAEITAMAIDRNNIYIAGWTNAPSWRGNLLRNNYGIAMLNIEGLLDEDMELVTEKQKNHNNNNHPSDNTNISSSSSSDIPTTSLFAWNPNTVPEDNSFSYNAVPIDRRRHRHRRKLRQRSVDAFLDHQHRSLSSTNNSTTMLQASPWSPIWDWLPNFEGTNGPILKLLPGKHDLDGSLFIGGSFDNLPALLLWNAYPNRLGVANITAVGGVHSLHGLVTSVAEIFLPLDPSSQDDSHPINNNPINSSGDYTFVILLACVGLGVLLGLGFTIGCYSRYPYLDSNLDGIGGGEVEDYTVSDTAPIGAISLTTLSDGHGNAVDFKECFERAMKFRHLPTYETLIIINPKEILLSKIIGEGSFGRVWSGQWRNNAVAVKEFVFAQAAIAGGSLQRNNIIEEIVGEAGVMACLRHPKILQLYGCSLTMQAIWIVSELCVRGSLKMILMDHSQELPLMKRLSICMDVADGMSYLHNRPTPIIHRDLKSHNIFITETSPGHFVAKIGDWGSARAVALTGSKSMTQGVGTACWLSPEVINNAHFSKSSDVYAFGIILWEVFTRQEIYEGLSAAQIIAKVAHEGLRPQVPRHCPWSKIMTKCWKQDPSERPDFEHILSNLSSIQQKYLFRMQEKHNQQQQQQPPGSSATGQYRTFGNSAMIHHDGDMVSQSSSEDLSKQFSNTSTIDESHLPSAPTMTTPPHHSLKVTPERVKLKSSPSQELTRSSSSRHSPARRFYDAFHPSLENIRMSVREEHSRSAKEAIPEGNHLFSSHSGLGSSRSIDSAAHLAPEIAQLEMRSLLLDDDSMSLLTESKEEIPMHFAVSRDHEEEEEEDDHYQADSTDFLFAYRHKKIRK